MNESQLRAMMVEHGRSLFQRGYVAGQAGNISAKTDDALLMTPTNSCLGRLAPEAISKVSMDGKLISGMAPSKELALHLAVYRVRPEAAAIVHLHATYSTAVSCLEDVDPRDVLPPLTPYYVMRVGKLPLTPYFAPGTAALADAVGAAAKDHHAILLANHGLVLAGTSLDAAVYAAEELEESAKLFLLLRGLKTRTLSAGQVAELKSRKMN
jgi:ribulose-5-phosphate 4-epimerase/fuculose-1-phosphate aldolase